MGRRHHLNTTKSHTLPSSPTHSLSSSSSDFEFTISLSPRKSSAASADELFYKGQLLPLHHHHRLSMLRSLLLSSSSTSSSDGTNTTASRDSSASSDSSNRPSSAAEHEFIPLTTTTTTTTRKSSKYFSLSKFSSVFRKNPPPSSGAGAAAKRVSAKEVIRKYLSKVKPLYEKLSQKQQKMSPPTPPERYSRSANTTLCMNDSKPNADQTNVSLSFSGNLRYPRRRSCVSSCPSSMRSSPSHAKNGYGYAPMGRIGVSSDSSSMEELQSAIQGAIAHCKNSMITQNKSVVSNEI